MNVIAINAENVKFKDKLRTTIIINNNNKKKKNVNECKRYKQIRKLFI